MSSAAACAAAGTALATEVANGERCANAARAASVSAWVKRSVSREEARRRRRRLRAASISVSICRLCSPIACLSPLRSEAWPSPTPFSIHATACGHNANLSTPTSTRARGVEGDAGKGGNVGKNKSEHWIAFPVSAKRRRGAGFNSKRQMSDLKVQASEFKLHVCAQWRLDTAEARIKERSMARSQGRDSGYGNRSGFKALWQDGGVPVSRQARTSSML